MFLTKTKLLDRLDEMIEAAEKGTFNESKYDETKLSRLEIKWKRFLASSVISEKKVEEERDKIKNLISDISHQTKTPLANIILYSELLKEKITDAELVTDAEQIMTQTKKLEFLIQSLIKTSRLESGVLSLTPKQQEIAPMLEELLREFIKAAECKNIMLTLDTNKETACFDRKWTKEAVGNLIDNAIKYTEEGGKISIRVNAYQMFAEIVVKDNGIGIKEEEQAQIFGRFYRGEEVREEEGVGIGLYLTREIAAMQGGYVRVKSSYKKGSTFSFYVPANLSKL